MIQFDHFSTSPPSLALLLATLYFNWDPLSRPKPQLPESTKQLKEKWLQMRIQNMGKGQPLWCPMVLIKPAANRLVLNNDRIILPNEQPKPFF